MRRKESVFVVILIAALDPTHAFAAESTEGYGFLRRDSGQVGAVVGYESSNRKSSASSAVSSSTETASSGRPTTPPIIVSIKPNPCVGITGGDDTFELFSASPGCGGFVAPAPPELATDDDRKRNRRRRPSPQELAYAAADRARALAQDPQLRAAPRGVGLTGLDSYFWIANEPRPIVATAAVRGVSVTAEARPVQYVWDFGDGDTKVTTDGGRAWARGRPGDISHLYEARGSYLVSIEVIWEARWRLGLGPWQHLGYFTTDDSRDYPVREVIAMLVRAR